MHETRRLSATNRHILQPWRAAAAVLLFFRGGCRISILLKLPQRAFKVKLGRFQHSVLRRAAVPMGFKFQSCLRICVPDTTSMAVCAAAVVENNEARIIPPKASQASSYPLPGARNGAQPLATGWQCLTLT